MSQHQEALKWVTSHIGETEHPPGSNRGPFVQSCQAATWLGGTGWPWCVATWVKAWTVAGAKLPYLGAGAYQTLDWYRKNRPSWVVPLDRARPGAGVIFNEGSGHMATLAEPFHMTRPFVKTIDGNVSDSVAARSRPSSLVRGVVDPPEDVSPEWHQVAGKPPLFEVVSSSSGHKRIYVSTASAVAKKLPLILKRHPIGVTVRPKRNK